MSEARRRVLGTFAIVIAATCFGTLGPLSRLAYDRGMTALGFATWRALFGAILLTVVLAALVARGRPLVRLTGLRR
jgi:drug/metabolite transporter (DMT)-like permease